MSQIQEAPIPLDKKVRLKEEVHGEKYREIQARGFRGPRRPQGEVLHLTGQTIVEIANEVTIETASGTREIPVKAYQRSQGKYRGRVMHAEDKENAYAARQQFADVLEERTSD